MKHSNLKARVTLRQDGKVWIELWNAEEQAWEFSTAFLPLRNGSDHSGPYFISATIVSKLYVLQEQGYKIEFA